MNLTVGEAVIKTAKYLSGLGMDSPRLEAELLLAFVLGWERVKIYQNWDCPLEEHEVSRYRETLVQRARGAPMAYIAGKKSFLSWDFKVSPDVLIPRPETELLVEMALRAIDAWNLPAQEIVCADFGTGSGIIAVALAKLRPGVRVDAYDISRGALAVARENAVLLGVGDQVTLIEGDMGQAPQVHAPQGGYHLVVSNPPYIPSGDLKGLSKEVKQEPQLALDGGDDGLHMYRLIIQGLPRTLRMGGQLIMEHGYDQAEALRKLLEPAGFETVEEFSDLAGLPRVIWGRTYNKTGR